MFYNFNSGYSTTNKNSLEVEPKMSFLDGILLEIFTEKRAIKNSFYSDVL